MSIFILNQNYFTLFRDGLAVIGGLWILYQIYEKIISPRLTKSKLKKLYFFIEDWLDEIEILNQFKQKVKNKCLYCYQLIDGDGDFHEKCCMEFFGTSMPPLIPYSIDQMADLAKEVVERSIAVPGVQPKLSMSVVKETRENSDTRLTVVGALGGQYILKPPSDRFWEMPENEHATMRIAEAYGIRQR